MARRFADPIKGLLLFGILGPPLGSLLYSFLLLGFGVVLSAEGAVRLTGSTGTTLAELASRVAAHALFSYLPGLVPALLTGLLAGVLRRRLTRGSLCLVSSVSAAFFSVVVMAAWQWSIVREPSWALQAGLDLVPYGLFAGAICGWLLGLPRFNHNTSDRSG